MRYFIHSVTKSAPRLPSVPQPGGSRGAALVVVLSLLVLVVALVVLFLGRAGTERVASARYKASAVTRQLADSAVNLVQAQINLATTEGANVAWASQPGMIRTFDLSGSLANAYKLYSADAMVASAIDLAADLPPADWAARAAEWTDLNEPLPDAANIPVYPILDPAAEGQIPGFSIGSPPGATPEQLVPMPVRWLYVLRDGRMVLPVGGGNGTQITLPGATSDNPVVGRVAFWTDDETAKVNINTASEGTYWDTPRVSTDEEKSYGIFQPAQREWQAYPGHPATTSLSAIFPGLSRSEIYDLVPRVNGGGSEGGTVRVTNPITADTDRLYASVDEMIFDMGRAVNAPLTKDQIARARFFLTAFSRAPETNLHNQPRLSIWPVHMTDSAAFRTPFDKLIARCATVGGLPYFFQRLNSQSPTNDAAIPRNQQLYVWLQRLMASPVPGFGGTFSGKYPADADQILTGIFDYIRCTNLVDYQFSATGNTYTPWASFSPGHGQVAPMKMPNGTMGFGRFNTVSEAALHFICTADYDIPVSNTVGNKTLGGTLLTANQRRIEAMLLLELFSPAHGFTAINPDMQIRIRGLEQFTINGTSLGFPATGSVNMTLSPAYLTSQSTWGGAIGFRYPLLDHRLPARGVMPADSGWTSENSYPFVSVPITVDAAANTMSFGGGTIEIEIYANTSSPVLVQTLSIDFPSAPFPIPTLQPITIVDPGGGAVDNPGWWSFSADGAFAGLPGRMSRLAIPWRIFIIDKDVVKSITLAEGDARLSAARQSTPDSLFEPHRWYGDTAHPLAHQLGSSYIDTVGEDTVGKLVTAATYNGRCNVDIPAGVTSANATGDWDNGLSHFRDGAYINKPDEGEIVEDPPYEAYFEASELDTDLASPNFSPNRIIPSPGMFGSLPTGVLAGSPWQTLLFRPQAGHPGALPPKDYLLLDLFWMPVVEPYAISDPFSTSGKINLNYQILPFTYLTRDTGVRALLKSEKVLTVPTTASGYKNNGLPGPGMGSVNWRKDVDIPYVLDQCMAKFTSGEIFKSAAEICDINLLNVDWSDYALTGDNARERPYTTIYPRITTKSNTYTVHFRAQSLKQSRSAPPDSWDENSGSVLGEYRGATTLERYLDPNTPGLPNYATEPGAPTLDTFYRWRIVRNTQFAL